MMRDSLRRLTSEEKVYERRVGGMRILSVELLDGALLNLSVDRKSKGSDLLDQVCDHLGVTERDYFGLLHAVRGDPRVWLDLNRRAAKSFKNEPWEVKFSTKFYPPEPSELEDEVARDQLMFSVRRDLLEGRLSCSFITHALLASYILQSELGDFEEEHVKSSILLEHRVAPASLLTQELEEKISELYQLHKGQNPAEAVQNYLENAKKLPLYGAALHCARDADEADIVLAVCATSLSVYRDQVLMNRFPWAKIIKISYNKRLYTLKLRASEFEDFESIVSFRLPSTTACKKLWRCSVEHHMFFRRETPVPVKRHPSLGLGTRRLSCRRTLRQMRAEPKTFEHASHIAAS